MTSRQRQALRTARQMARKEQVVKYITKHPNTITPKQAAEYIMHGTGIIAQLVKAK